VVAVTVHPKVGWRVPTDEWERVLAHVREKYDETEGRVGREVRRAMREWIDADEFADVEREVDRLVRAAGRTPAALAEKKRGSDHPASGDTTLVQTRAPRDLKEEFAASAREQGERPGVYLARALRERRAGGRARRVLAKLDRVSDDAEALLAEVDPEGDDDMSLRERRTVAICRRLEGEFPEDELEAAIGAVAGDSPPTLREYRERVLDRLEYVEHPNAPEIYVPEDTAREIAEGTDAPGPDAPAVERKPYPKLAREEKVHGVHVAAARRAARNDGRAQLDAAAVRTAVFDGEPSEGHARDLMRVAGQADGFEFGKRYGKDRLRVDLRDMTDDDLLEAARDAMAGGEAGEADATPGVEAGETGEDDPETDAKSEMDHLMAATPATGDGGDEE
jgi:hypothetical protein